jgi:hypothetical protein
MLIVTVSGEAVGEAVGVGDADGCSEGVGDGLTDSVGVGLEAIESGGGELLLHAARPSTRAVVIQGRIDRFILGSYSDYHRRKTSLRLGEV